MPQSFAEKFDDAICNPPVKLTAFLGLCLVAATVITATQELPPLSAAASAAMPAALHVNNVRYDGPFMSPKPMELDQHKPSMATGMARYDHGIKGLPDASITSNASYQFHLIEHAEPKNFTFGPHLRQYNSGNKIAQRPKSTTQAWSGFNIDPMAPKELRDRIQAKPNAAGGFDVVVAASQDKEPMVLWVHATPIKEATPTAKDTRTANEAILTIGGARKLDFEEAVTHARAISERTLKSFTIGLAAAFFIAIAAAARFSLLGGNKTQPIDAKLGDKVKSRRNKKTKTQNSTPKSPP